MQALQTNLKKTFLELIHIDEIYEEEKEVVKYVLDVFKQLHIPTKKDAFGNIIAYFPGKGTPIMLNTHLDIPENVPNLEYTDEGKIIRATGKSILGADPKSGLAILLELAKYLKKDHIKTCPIEFVFTRGEEAGLFGAKNLDYSLLKSKMGLVLDEDGPVSSVVTKAPTFYMLDVAFEGKIVHPRDWKDGINALAYAARAIAKLRQGEIVKGVTFNIGIFHAGTARNTTPGMAELKAEMRSYDTKKLVQAAKKVEKAFKDLEKDSGLKVHIKGSAEFEGYTLTKNHPLFQRIESVYKLMKIKPNYYPTFGGSDANIFNSHGIRAVALGSGYYLAHQYTEYVNFEDMEKIFNFLLRFVGSEK